MIRIVKKSTTIRCGLSEIKVAPKELKILDNSEKLRETRCGIYTGIDLCGEKEVRLAS